MKFEELLDQLIQAWRTGDAHRASAFFGVDATYQEAGHEPIVGREAIAEHFVRFFRDGPPWRFDREETIVQGNLAAVAYRFGIKGDGQIWRERAGCALVRLEGGLIATWREFAA